MAIKLRDSLNTHLEPWPVGSIPDRVIHDVGKQLVHRLAIGHIDIAGNDFGTIFAAAVKGEHRVSSLGLADIVANGTAWSLKTIKNKTPYDTKVVRLISGRNSPDYSVGIADPRKDPQATGRAVLDIWNSRVKQSLNHYEELRIAVLIRNVATREFCLFEQPVTPFPADEFKWSFNKQGNLEGHNKATGRHTFTWQPHGSQFTIKRIVPGSVRRFTIVPNVPLIQQEQILELIRYEPNWISAD